jgi:hypothetical protein
VDAGAAADLDGDADDAKSVEVCLHGVADGLVAEVGALPPAVGAENDEFTGAGTRLAVGAENVDFSCVGAVVEVSDLSVPAVGAENADFTCAGVVLSGVAVNVDFTCAGV